MNARTWATGLLAAGGLFLGAANAHAGDTVKLGLPPKDDTPAVALGKLSADADTIDARFRGGFGGGFRGGVRVGYRGYYGGYRGFYGGYRGFYGVRVGIYGGLAPYYGYYNYPTYPYAYPTSYYGYPYAYPTSYYGYPSAVVTPIATSPSYRIMPPADGLSVPYTDPEVAPAPRPSPLDPTFPYDGGPRAPLPPLDQAPIGGPTQLKIPGSTIPLEGRPVSLPATKTPVKLTYPAFGELPRTK